MATTRMWDLPQELVVEIFKRVPITSLKAVRCTCKTLDAITKNCFLGKPARGGTHQFLTMSSKVYSLRYHFGGGEEDVSVSVKQVDLLNELDISKVYHCDGLVLCVAKVKDNSKNSEKLVLWNPYLCQTRWIIPRENFHGSDRYAIGYSEDDKKNKKRNNHKILRFLDTGFGPGRDVGCEIYEISSDSWRVLKVNPEWEIDEHQRGVSVNGNTYFIAHEKHDDVESDDYGHFTPGEDFLLCFEFTKERFGPRLPLPFHSYGGDCTTLSSFRHDEQLAALFGDFESSFFEIWLTLTVDPDHVSWNKFLRVETWPLLTSLKFRLSDISGGSFFVDEENKVAVVFELNKITDPHQHTAFVFGQDGYIQSVNLGEALKLQHYCQRTGKHFKAVLPPLVCSSSYRPSLVQVKQPLLHQRKRKATHV